MSNNDNNIEKRSFEAFVNAIGSEIEQAQVRLISAANAQMLFHYWKMGNYILYHQNRQGWGGKVIKKLEQLYEGKAKKVFATSDPNVVIVSYKDDATAFNGLKKGTITGKGAINNRMTNNLMRRLEEKGVPYGKGLPNPEAPHIPEDKEIEEETMPGQGEPTPTAPEVPAGRHAAEPIRSGIPADAVETGNGYENPPEDATDRDDTPPKAGAEESDTRILPAQEGKTDLGRDESGDLDPARARDVSGQFGARMRRSETYYPNLAAFVERFVANVFCYHQSASVNMQWVSDWWRYPALVFPLDAMWRAYENARKAPGQMMIFYIQAASMLDRVFDKDRGIVASLDCKQNLTRKGEPLPCERPNRAWREPILETLSVPAAGGKENKETTITPTRRRNNGSN